MVDPEAGEVSAILDWDGCGLLPMDFEWPSICGLTEACFGEGEEEAEALLKELGFVKPVGFEVRKKLLEVILKVRYMVRTSRLSYLHRPSPSLHCPAIALP
jgi:hypothetical protein